MTLKQQQQAIIAFSLASFVAFSTAYLFRIDALAVVAALIALTVYVISCRMRIDEPKQSEQKPNWRVLSLGDLADLATYKFNAAHRSCDANGNYCFGIYDPEKHKFIGVCTENERKTIPSVMKCIPISIADFMNAYGDSTDAVLAKYVPRMFYGVYSETTHTFVRVVAVVDPKHHKPEPQHRMIPINEDDAKAFYDDLSVLDKYLPDDENK